MTASTEFSSRVHERMTAVGERYGALTDDAVTPTTAEPQHSAETLMASTGRTWDEWVRLIEAGPGRTAEHAAIARWLQDEHGVDAWWAQSITVGYERITGLRLPGQMPDGTFTVSRSRIVPLEADEMRRLLHDDAARAQLFPGFQVALRSTPAAKSPRFDLAREGRPLGRVLFYLDPAAGGRLRITATHEKLPTHAHAEHWKPFWAEWLDAVDASAR